MKVEYKQKPKNCALICAYNEEAAIRDIAQRTLKYVDELIIVNDGSTDNTSNEIFDTGARIFTHSHNQGKGKALQTGINYFLKSEYDNLITLDADGQHLPEDIPRFIETLNKGYDVVIGHRDFKGKHVPKSRKYANKFDAKALSFFLKTNLKDPQNGFRMFKKDAIKKALENITSKGFSFEIETLINMVVQGTKIGWTTIPTIYDNKIKSHIKPLKHVKDSIGTYLHARRKRRKGF